MSEVAAAAAAASTNKFQEDLDKLKVLVETTTELSDEEVSLVASTPRLASCICF